jgi:hypothetical protein
VSASDIRRRCKSTVGDFGFIVDQNAFFYYYVNEKLKGEKI